MARTCEDCGVELVRPSQSKFCSNKCQRAMERAKHTRLWLETGVAATISGNRRHYVQYISRTSSERYANGQSY